MKKAKKNICTVQKIIGFLIFGIFIIGLVAATYSIESTLIQDDKAQETSVNILARQSSPVEVKQENLDKNPTDNSDNEYQDGLRRYGKNAQNFMTVADESYGTFNSGNKILFDQGHGSASISSYSTLISELTAAGYDVENTTNTITEALLTNYSVLVIPEATLHYSSSELSVIQSFVQSNHGLFVIGGSNHTVYSELTSFSGIDWLDGGRLGFGDIETHPVTTGVTMIFFRSPECELYVSNPALSLISVSGTNELSVSYAGSGRVVGIGDESTLTNSYIGDYSHLTMAINLIDWLNNSNPIDHETFCTLDTLNTVVLGDSVNVNFGVTNQGIENETDVELQLWINDVLINTTVFPKLLSGESETINYNWTPTLLGMNNVTVYVVPVEDETIVANNIVNIDVPVCNRSLILFDQGHGTFSISNYNTLVNELNATGFVVENTTDTITETLLAPYSVLVIPCPSGFPYFSNAEYSAIESFVLSGKGLFVIGEGFSTTTFNRLTSYAGITWGLYIGAGNDTTNDITSHSVTTGVSSVYFSSPENFLIPTSPAESLIRVGSSTAVFSASDLGFGRVAGISDGNNLDDSEIGQADNLLLAMNLIDWLSWARPQNHELICSIDCPSAVIMGDSTSINVTVSNHGLNDETGVVLNIWINNTLVNTTIIPSLLAGTSEIIDYFWDPSDYGIYNITAYVIPVTNEGAIFNNLNTEFVLVGDQIIDFSLGDHLDYEMNSGGTTFPFAQFDYNYFIDPTHINISMNIVGFDEWFSVNILTRLIEDGTQWVGDYYAFQIETNINIGDTIMIQSNSGNVEGTVWYDYNGNLLECWNISISAQNSNWYYHKPTGILLCSIDLPSTDELYLVDTNMIDMTNPDLNNPDDITYDEGSTGNSIVWTGGDTNPAVYNVTLDGSLYVSDTTWSNGTITVDIDGLTPGTYNFIIVVYDTTWNSATDLVQVTVNAVIVDTTSPDLDSPVDVIYDEGSTGNEIVWTAGDANPDIYNVTLDGSLYVSDTAWSNGTITVDINGLTAGVYTFTIAVYDDTGNSAADLVQVTVNAVIVDTTSPDLDSPSDVTYDEGSTGNEIVWTADDANPDVYNLTVDGSLSISDTAWSNGTITIHIDGLTPGIYTLTLVVYDTTGNSASDSVQVTVLPSTPDTTVPDLDSPGDVVYGEGSTGNSIVWSAGDANPAVYNVTMDGSVYISTTLWTNGTITVDIDSLTPGIHTFIIVVYDTSGNSAADLVQVTVNPIIDTIPPDLDSPGDVTFDEGETGNVIVWTTGDAYPAVYNVTMDGSGYVSTRVWTNGTITVDIDNLTPGTHTFIIVVYDTSGNSAADLVQVTVNPVIDTTAPALDSPNDITYDEGSTGNEIVWTAGDTNPDVYNVTLGGSLYVSETTWTNGTITVGIDGLTPGIYTFTIFVYDTAGNSATDIVQVTVLFIIFDTTSPDLDNPDDVVYDEGSTGNSIVWTAGDTYPDVYNVTLNGSIYVSTTTWTNGTITVDIDDLSPGTYIFTVVVYDIAGNSATDIVQVTVLSKTTGGGSPGFEILVILTSLVVLLIFRQKQKGKGKK